jgi:hypothetical protein
MVAIANPVASNTGFAGIFQTFYDRHALTVSPETILKIVKFETNKSV